MNSILLSPLVAFLIYFVMVGITSGLGALFSARGRHNKFKTAAYASGDSSDVIGAFRYDPNAQASPQ